MKTVEVQLDEARAVIAALRVASTRLGYWTTVDSAVQTMQDILDAEPSELLAARTVTLHADELAAESERLEQLIDSNPDYELTVFADESAVWTRIGVLDQKVCELRAQTRFVVRP